MDTEVFLGSTHVPVRELDWSFPRRWLKISLLGYVISYNLFSFRGSVQDYKIHMDMEIVKFA